MTYTEAVRDFLEREGLQKGILIIKNDGSWIHLTSGHTFDLARYAAAENPEEALLEVASDLDQLDSK